MSGSIRDTLEEKLARFEQLERDMSDPEVLADGARMSATAREHGGLAKIANKYREFKRLTDEIRGCKEMAEAADDPEEREMAEPEMESLREQREDALGRTVVPDRRWRRQSPDALRDGNSRRYRRRRSGTCSPAICSRCIAAMPKHAGWKTEIMDASPTEMGGFKEVTLTLEGEGVYRDLQYESGGHRVQRVPETETQGRVHTSAATVAVMPEPEDVEVELKPDDYRVDKFGASGPGGQHVNKTESAIRLTHHETGIVVQCQDEKSQHKNLAKALRVLKARIYEKKREEEDGQAGRAAKRPDRIGGS